MHARRVLGTAAVFATGVCAGTMESSNGSAKDTPMPRKIVRRERCFLVMNIALGLLIQVAGNSIGRRVLIFFCSSHLERRAFHDPQNERGKSVVVFGGLVLDGADERHIVIVDHAADAISQKIFREGSNESIGVVQDRLAKAGGTV